MGVAVIWLLFILLLISIGVNYGEEKTIIGLKTRVMSAEEQLREYVEAYESLTIELKGSMRRENAWKDAYHGAATEVLKDRK